MRTIKNTSIRSAITGSGGRIFYITPDRELMSVEIDLKKQVVSAPRLVASTGIIGAALSRVSI